MLATFSYARCTQFAPHNFLKVRKTMLWIVVIILALIVVLTVYTVRPTYDLYRLASAVETRNAAAFLVDFPSLRASLIKQVLDTDRKRADKSVVRSESLATGIGWPKHSTQTDCLICLARDRYRPIQRCGRVLPHLLRRKVSAVHRRFGLTRTTAAEPFM
jgi:Protein of unknown function (DUF2939)